MLAVPVMVLGSDGDGLPLEVEADFSGERARRHIVGSAERREEVVEGVLIGDIDRGEPEAPFALFAVEEVVFPRPMHRTGYAA